MASAVQVQGLNHRMVATVLASGSVAFNVVQNLPFLTGAAQTGCILDEMSHPTACQSPWSGVSGLLWGPMCKGAWLVTRAPPPTCISVTAEVFQDPIGWLKFLVEHVLHIWL